MDFINHSLPSRLLCPAVRTKNITAESFLVQEESQLIVDNPYYISNDKDEDDESSHSHHLLPLIGCNNRETTVANIQVSKGREGCCGACNINTIGTTYYFCIECDKWYHRECVESPSVFKSPYHPKHSLQLHVSLQSPTILECQCLISSFSLCLIYYCNICDFSLDPVCATKPPFINYKKRHEHTLYYFPRKSNVMCDVCRGDDNKYLIFVCLLCDFMVHRRCIYLPQVIKISRHKHRLSFAFSLSFGEIMACGVCRKIIDEDYGVYTCLKNDCIYVVHTQCATSGLLGAIWDGKELEGELEEDEESIKSSFEEISNGIILHFSHPEHPMRLDEDIKIWHDGEKYCQACIAPLYDGKAYICMECDYVLHEECACLPRVKQLAFHAHSLHLEPSRNQLRTCECCWVQSCGFKYVCYNTDSDDCKVFVLDVRCASISEPHNHHPHRHPLFFNSSRGECSICEKRRTISLTCDECRFFLCFCCATFPYKVRYKNHEHLLTFTYKEVLHGDEYWYDRDRDVYSCDLCEEAIIPPDFSRAKRFYRCEECEVALHIECLLWKDVYTNPGSRVTLYNGKEFNIVENNALTRPICTECGKRCKYRMILIASPSGDIYCSAGHTSKNVLYSF